MNRDIICHNEAEVKDARKVLLQEIRAKTGRSIRSHHPDYYSLAVIGGGAVIEAVSTPFNYLDIDQAKQFHAFLGEAIAAVEENIGRDIDPDDTEDFSFFVTCFLGVPDEVEAA